MKILLLNQAFYPDSVATSQYVTDIARELYSQGHEITVLCARRDYTEPRLVYRPFEFVDGIRVHRVGSTRFGKESLLTRILDTVNTMCCPYGAFSVCLATTWSSPLRRRPLLAFTARSPRDCGALASSTGS